MSTKAIAEGNLLKDIMSNKSLRKEWNTTYGQKPKVRGVIIGNVKIFFPEEFVTTQSKLDTKSLGSMKLHAPKYSDGNIFFLRAPETISDDVTWD